ncbi:flagellar hook-length control protein FliK [Roseateles sp. YR242]|uniref:flagellar hook-length control protein FliK n=1 Tax=Roseateles sp. YR242 TaxID=1855305 RepID=UPI0008CDA009|nr:flagellar hook-length control protein FliK [Roseateles sp. YR242]SEL46035.1 flagellar hook-length control protein FliK [Roseateles sp. YR242]
MSHIPLHQNTTSTHSALSALGGTSANTRKDSGRAQAAQSSPSAQQSFSQMLNQSSQHLQAQAPQPQAFTQAATQTASQQASKTPAKAPAPPASNTANGSANGISGSAQEENKLNARNAANRSAANRSANKQAEAPKAPATPAHAQTEAADKAHGNKAQGKSADGADPAAAGEGTDKTAGQDDGATAARTDGTDPAAAAQQMMAMLRGEVPQDPKLALKDGGVADGAADGHGAVGGHGKGGHHAGAAADHDPLQQDLQQAMRAALDGKTEAGEGAEGLQALAGGSQEMTLGASHEAGGTHQSFEAMLAAAQQADAAGGTTGTDQAGAADAPSVPLSQPLDSPEFAPELSASVSLLIQDGVHEAQLQLNPTDMGPVSIQIQMDGQQAQVNFHAEQAATRDALMRSMPDLAAALQSQGLTLSGGGVFAQAQSGSGQNGRGSDSDEGSRRGGRGGQGDDGLTAVARPERRSQPRGLVDLYA